MKNTFNKKYLIIVEVILMFYAITLIFPYVWILLNSFKSVSEFYQSIWSLPKTFNIQNYISAIKETNIIVYFKNSILITVFATFIQILLSSSVAYVLAKYEFRGRNIIFALAVSGLLIPVSGTLAPFYLFMSKLGLFNTQGLFLYYASGMGTNMLIFYGFFKALPWAYAEAAYIDGANDFQIFRKIMLPMAKGPIIAVGTISAISIWNDYFIPSILLTNPKQQTIAVGLHSLYVQQQFAASWTVLFAAIIISALPTIILYVFLHDKISKGFMLAGLKG